MTGNIVRTHRRQRQPPVIVVQRQLLDQSVVIGSYCRRDAVAAVQVLDGRRWTAVGKEQNRTDGHRKMPIMRRIRSPSLSKFR
jgi:hypothetical protein